jgi:hypothetical protein
MTAKKVRARDSGREVSFVRGEESGWTRIGRYDSAERRSLWCRIIGENERGDVVAIELCSGREGDDAFVRLDATNPQWRDLCDVLLSVEGDCGLPMPCVTPEKSKT